MRSASRDAQRMTQTASSKNTNAEQATNTATCFSGRLNWLPNTRAPELNSPSVSHNPNYFLAARNA